MPQSDEEARKERARRLRGRISELTGKPAPRPAEPDDKEDGTAETPEPKPAASYRDMIQERMRELDDESED